MRQGTIRVQLPRAFGLSRVSFEAHGALMLFHLVRNLYDDLSGCDFAILRSKNDVHLYVI